MEPYICPRCGASLEPCDDGGLWCSGGCYVSAFDLWFSLETKARNEVEEKQYKELSERLNIGILKKKGVAMEIKVGQHWFTMRKPISGIFEMVVEAISPSGLFFKDKNTGIWNLIEAMEFLELLSDIPKFEPKDSLNQKKGVK